MGVRQGTYSIVARDAQTGELGVAVQSHWFSVGSVVSWAQSGVGAVATQSIAEIAHGPGALERLAAGGGAQAALAELLAADEQARFRQVAVIDARGEVAVHTGESCIPFAGHEVGEDFSCQANMMASETVWPAMARAFREAEGDLAERMVAALDAAETEGGDVRGRQSAALVVVGAEGEPWRKRFELRVEDHPDPLVELRRVLGVARAYELASEGDELVGEGRTRRPPSAMQPRSSWLPTTTSSCSSPASRGCTAGLTRRASSGSAARWRPIRDGRRCYLASARRSRPGWASCASAWGRSSVYWRIGSPQSGKLSPAPRRKGDRMYIGIGTLILIIILIIILT